MWDWAIGGLVLATPENSWPQAWAPGATIGGIDFRIYLRIQRPADDLERTASAPEFDRGRMSGTVKSAPMMVRTSARVNLAGHRGRHRLIHSCAPTLRRL